MSDFQLSGRYLPVAHPMSTHPSVTNIPILHCRIPFLSVQQLEGVSKSSLSLATSQVIKMKANTADAPYVVQKGCLTHWQFTLTYASVDQFLVMAHEQLAASRLPYADRKEALQVHALQMCCCIDPFQPITCPSLPRSLCSASLAIHPCHCDLVMPCEGISHCVLVTCTMRHQETSVCWCLQCSAFSAHASSPKLKSVTRMVHRPMMLVSSQSQPCLLLCR